jgi:hypothetical protein
MTRRPPQGCSPGQQEALAGGQREEHPGHLQLEGWQPGLAVARRLAATILSLIPGCQPGAWVSDYAMPERPVAPEEQVWSNMMDPTAAAKLLDEDS